MSSLFAFLFLFSIIGLVIGLIKPSLIKMNSKKQAVLVTVTSILVFFILFNITAPDIEETKQVDNQNVKAEKKEEVDKKLEKEKEIEEIEKKKKQELENEAEKKEELKKEKEAEKKEELKKKKEAEKKEELKKKKEAKKKEELKKKKEDEKKEELERKKAVEKKKELEKKKAVEKKKEKTDTTWDDVKEKDKIVGKSNKNFSDISKSKPRKVNNDKTGNWRKITLAESINTEEYALSYHDLHMKEDEVHFIINFNYNTTTWINEMNGLLFVDVREYIKREEHDAKSLGSGMVLQSYVIYPDGDIQEIEQP